MPSFADYEGKTIWVKIAGSTKPKFYILVSSDDKGLWLEGPEIGHLLSSPLEGLDIRGEPITLFAPHHNIEWVIVRKGDSRSANSRIGGTSSDQTPKP